MSIIASTVKSTIRHARLPTIVGIKRIIKFEIELGAMFMKTFYDV
jgi:hypothetical protein